MERRFDSLLFLGSAVAGIVACALIAAPFLAPLTGALTFAIIFEPVQRSFENRLKHPSLAALGTVVVCGIVLVLPSMFVLERLATEAASAATYIRNQIESFQGLTRRFPSLEPVVSWIERHIDLPSIAATAATQLSQIVTSLLRGSVAQALSFVLTFYFLFFFLRDRRTAARLLSRLLPLSPSEADRLFVRVIDTVHATILGTIAVAIIQGALAGLMFWMIGLPTPVVWGAIMALLSIVPVLGTFIVWVPAAIFLALEGSWTKAIVLALWGVIVVGGIDNLLRPVLVGNRLRLHTVVAFISILGGLFLFGAAGFVLGPLVFTVTALLIEFWREKTSSSDVQHSVADRPSISRDR